MGLFRIIAFRLGKHIDIFAVYSNRTKVLFCEKKQQLINQYCFNWFMYQFYTIFIPVCFY